MNQKIKLPKKGIDGFYGHVSDYSGQETEKNLRENVASKKYPNYLDIISKHHSIPVMDAEVEQFLKCIPKNGWILDIGGCWGWHWRNIPQIRPDIKVVILDFIRQNLSHAKIILKDDLDKNFYLVHGNALSLDFDNNSFDGVWSVQTTQHIPEYRKVLLEVFRVLKTKGTFADYNLNTARLLQFIYQLFGKKYHLEGNIKDILHQLSQKWMVNNEYIMRLLLFLKKWNLEKLNRAADKIGETEVLIRKNSHIKKDVIIKNLIIALSNEASTSS